MPLEPAGPDTRSHASDLARFLGSLAEQGRPVISAASSETPDDDATPLLEDLDSRARAELALELPAFSPPAALWAARLLHQLGRFVV